MSPVICERGARRILLARPNGSDRGQLAIDMSAALALARRHDARACLLRPPVVGDEALFALTTDDVDVVRPDGFARMPCRGRWLMASTAHAVRERVAAGAASLWQELHVELRQHAGDERLPSTLRGGLRRLAQNAASRSRPADDGWRFPRRALREAVRTRLPNELRTEAERIAATLGLAAGTRLVALELRTRLEPLLPAIGFLIDQGYTVVRIGGTAAGPARQEGVVDVAHAPGRTPLVDVFVMLECAFLICESADVQRAAYLTNTPCLLLNATDPVASYPVRADGLYTLRTAVHLDTGARLAARDLVDETYVRDRRNFGFVNTPAGDVLAAVREMHQGVANGWSESAAQARFRTCVADAAAALATRLPQTLRWGPDDGFLGDGRLAAVQAERAL